MKIAGMSKMDDTLFYCYYKATHVMIVTGVQLYEAQRIHHDYTSDMGTPGTYITTVYVRSTLPVIL